MKFKAYYKKSGIRIKEKLLLISEAGNLYKLSDNNLGVDYYNMAEVEIKGELE